MHLRPCQPAIPHRAERSLDGRWGFVADPHHAFSPTELPRTESILVPGCWETQLRERSGALRGWYRREFVLPQAWRGGRIYLRVGAAMYHATVWLNGTELGAHEGGFTAFEVELTRAVRYAARNVLVVRVDNPLNALGAYPTTEASALDRLSTTYPDWPIAEIPHGKQTWYTSTSGLWKSVSLVCRPPTFLHRVKVTPSLARADADIAWQTDGRLPGSAQVAVELVDPTGIPVASASVPAGEGFVRISIPSPTAWSPATPVLYEAHLRLLDRGKPLDALAVRFGLRDVEVRQGRLFLNGEPLLVIGALDQDFHHLGLASHPPRSRRARVHSARRMGLNLLRYHLKGLDETYLDAADTTGLMVWGELPSWTRMSTTAAERARQTLRELVDEHYNHPSLIAWSIINEGWGTRLHESSSDRTWLVETATWLKAVDPTRLVVDNSPCETSSGPGFHLVSDLADFHAYRRMPDGAAEWRVFCTDFARRPAWLWSPYGDAQPRGDEPLVMSEFGTWGLPAPAALQRLYGSSEPWWFATGPTTARPAGLERRFVELALNRVWPSLDALAADTQHLQFDALAYQIGQLRRHPEIAGYVITQLTDTFWEANGLLDVGGRPKSATRRFIDLNGPEAIFAHLDRWDYWDDECLSVDVYVSSSTHLSDPVEVRWRITCPDQSVAGKLTDLQWPAATPRRLATLRTELPAVRRATLASLHLEMRDGQGRKLARQSTMIAIVPSARRRSLRPLRVRTPEHQRAQLIEDRLSSLGHDIVGAGQSLDVEVVSSLEVVTGKRDHAVLLLARDPSATTGDCGFRIVPRRAGRPDIPDRSGNWIGAFAWIDPNEFQELPRVRLLGFPFAGVYPDHVIEASTDEIMGLAGLFVGWLNAPALLIAETRHRRLLATTFRLVPEDGPLARLLLEQLLQRAAAC